MLVVVKVNFHLGHYYYYYFCAKRLWLSLIKLESCCYTAFTDLSLVVSFMYYVFTKNIITVHIINTNTFTISTAHD